MTIFRSNAKRNALMAALTTQRGTSARIELRTLAPDGVGGAGVLLALLTGNATAWAAAAVAGVLTSNAITADASADATGTVAHYELLTSASVWLESGIADVGGTDGVTIDNTSVVAGQTVQMSGNWVNTAAYDDGV